MTVDLFRTPPPSSTIGVLPGADPAPMWLAGPDEEEDELCVRETPPPPGPPTHSSRHILAMLTPPRQYRYARSHCERMPAACIVGVSEMNGIEDFHASGWSEGEVVTVGVGVDVERSLRPSMSVTLPPGGTGILLEAAMESSWS